MTDISGYVTSSSKLSTTLSFMNANRLHRYRLSFGPPWENYKPYTESYIWQILNSGHPVIVDRIHLWGGDDLAGYNQPYFGFEAAKKFRRNLSWAKSVTYDTLYRFKNNPWVTVELANEYVDPDLYTIMQQWVNEIRARGITNPLVINFWTYWKKLYDPLNNLYFGKHYYFDYATYDFAVNDQYAAMRAGISSNRLLNTEVGANSDDSNYCGKFTWSQVNALNRLLAWGDANARMCVWLNQNKDNYDYGYSKADHRIAWSSYSYAPPPGSPTGGVSSTTQPVQEQPYSPSPTPYQTYRFRRPVPIDVYGRNVFPEA